jgi:hypothetical protein
MLHTPPADANIAAEIDQRIESSCSQGDYAYSSVWLVP